MIENKNQYRVTTEQLAKLESGLASMSNMPPTNVHPTLWQAQRDGLQSQIDELREQLAVWDKTKEEIQP